MAVLKVAQVVQTQKQTAAFLECVKYTILRLRSSEIDKAKQRE